MPTNPIIIPTLLLLLSTLATPIEVHLDCSCTISECEVELFRVDEHETTFNELYEPVNNLEASIVSRDLFYEHGTEMTFLTNIIGFSGLNLMRVTHKNQEYEFYQGISKEQSQLEVKLFKTLGEEEQFNFYGDIQKLDFLIMENVMLNVDLKDYEFKVLCDLSFNDLLI